MIMEKVYKVGFVGMGNQTLEVHLPAVLEHQRFCFDSFVEINKQTRDSISKKYDVFWYTDVDSLLRSRHLDVLIVSVPHNEYSWILKKNFKKQYCNYSREAMCF